METCVRKLDGEGIAVFVLQLKLADGEKIEWPPAPGFRQTSFAMLLDNWHQFEARHDDVWLFGFPRSGQGDEVRWHEV